MEIDAYMALAGLRAIRNVQIHANRGLIRFVGAGKTRRVELTTKGKAYLVKRSRIADDTPRKNVSIRVPKSLVRVKGTDGLPVVRSWGKAAAWLGISESSLRERRVAFILIEQETFPLVSSLEELKRDLAA
jgi:hypothetical protein